MIVFLDIDEVLSTGEAHQSGDIGEPPSPDWNYRHAISKRAVRLLNEALDTASGFDFVICSTWRRFLTCEQIEAHLKRNGLRGSFHRDWATPFTGRGKGEDIKAWLGQHSEVTSYVVVEDDHEASSAGNLILVKDQMRGFGETEKQELIDFIAGKQMGNQYKASSKPDISVLIPYYREPEKLRTCVASIVEKAGDDVRYEILIAIDDDDPRKDEAIQEATGDVKCHVWPRPFTLGEKLNKLASEAKGDILWFLAQDYTMETENWPGKFRACVSQLKNGVGVLYPHDDLHPDHSAFPIITRKMAETVGYFMPQWFVFWFCDTWWDEIGIIIGNKQEIPVTVKHQGKRGKSHGLTDLKFWAETFGELRALRVRDSIRLANIANGFPIDKVPEQNIIDEIVRRQQTCVQRVAHLLHPEFIKQWEANSASPPSPQYPEVKKRAEELVAKIQAMRPPKPKRVALCVPSTETWRSRMAVSFGGLTAYSSMSGIEICIVNVEGSMISHSRNSIVSKALEEKADYLLWIDSDMKFEPDSLMRLMKHDKDIVGATYCKKVPPYETLGRLAGPRPEQDPTGGLHEALLLPGGMLLVKIDVYKKLPWPWYAEGYRWPGDDGLESLKEMMRNCFRDVPPEDVLKCLDGTALADWVKGQFLLGEIGEPWAYLSEDLYFCRKARRYGFTIWMDLDLTDKVVHLGTNEVTCRLPRGEQQPVAAD